MPDPTPGAPTPDLRETRTWESLREAYARDAQAARLWSVFARVAEIEGLPEAAATLRALAELQAVEADGHLDLLARAGEPLLGGPTGDTAENLRAAGAALADHAYAGMAVTARAEGFPDIASWFETLALARAAHASAAAAALARIRGER